VNRAVGIDTIQEDVVGDVLTALVVLVGEVLGERVGCGTSAGGADQ
jgi:hypothetical protein